MNKIETQRRKTDKTLKEQIDPGCRPKQRDPRNSPPHFMDVKERNEGDVDKKRKTSLTEFGQRMRSLANCPHTCS